VASSGHSSILTPRSSPQCRHVTNSHGRRAVACCRSGLRRRVAPKSPPESNSVTAATRWVGISLRTPSPANDPAPPFLLEKYILRASQRGDRLPANSLAGQLRAKDSVGQTSSALRPVGRRLFAWIERLPQIPDQVGPNFHKVIVGQVIQDLVILLVALRLKLTQQFLFHATSLPRGIPFLCKRGS
jgi:hypothetical protein